MDTPVTGNLVWINPDDEIAVVVLSNRTYAKSASQTYGDLVFMRSAIMGFAYKMLTIQAPTN